MVDKTKEELAKAERDNINVTVTANNEDKEDLNNEENEDKEVEDKENEEAELDSKNTDANNEGSSEEKEDDEEKELSAKVKAKEDRRQERMQRRIDKATADAKAAKAEVERLQKQLEAKPDDEKVLTEEEVEKRSEVKAAQKAAERAFIADCNKLAEEAEKIDKDFTKKINVLTEDIGPIPSQMIGILSDLDNGAKILTYLTENEDEAEDIWKLSPAKMAVKLSKLSIQLNAKPKKEIKEISKVPEPNKSLGGKGGKTEVLHDKMDMNDWVQLRNKQVAERQAAKRNSMR